MYYSKHRASGDCSNNYKSLLQSVRIHFVEWRTQNLTLWGEKMNNENDGLLKDQLHIYDVSLKSSYIIA